MSTADLLKQAVALIPPRADCDQPVEVAENEWRRCGGCWGCRVEQFNLAYSKHLSISAEHSSTEDGES